MDIFEEQINKIRAGDKEVFNEILEKHKKMIYKIIYNQKIDVGDYQLDVESLFQEGCLSLYSAIFSYEKDKGMSFTSYAYMVVRSHITTYIRDSKFLNEELCSIDNTKGVDYHFAINNLCVNDNPIQYHREKEFEKTLNAFLNNLNDKDKTIFEMRGNDCSYKQISERLKVNTKYVDNRLRILRNRLRKYLEENE